MTDLTESLTELNIALERMNINNFNRQYTSSHVLSYIGRKIISLENIELPDNSVVHLVDRLTNTLPIPSYYPDVTNPIIANESYLIYLKYIDFVSPKENVSFPVIDTYRMTPSFIKLNENQFFKDNSQITRRLVGNIYTSLEKSNVLYILNYNPLLNTILTGTNIIYRKTDILFRTMLNTLLKIPNKNHYLYIPLSPTVLKKAQIDRSLNKLDNVTRSIKDPSYFFFLHFIGMFNSSCTYSYFKEIEKEYDLSSINIIFTVNNKVIIYNLKELKDLAQSPSFYMTLIRHINLLKISDSVSEVEDISDDDLDQLIQTQEKDVVEDSIDVENESSVVDLGTSNSSEGQDDHLDNSAYQKEIYKKESHVEVVYSLSKVETDSEKTAAQKNKFITTVEGYNEVELAGKSLFTYLHDDTPLSVEPEPLDFLDPLKVPDRSMIKSSIMDFDNLYIENQMQKDIAEVITSLTPHGMAVESIKETDELSDFNRIRYYVVTYIDTTGKRHQNKFKLPIPDKDGVILVNGIRSKFVKQQINVPICKVSSSRVNLSSNFNKTLIERVDTVANNLSIFITKYIVALERSGLIKIEYGSYKSIEPYPYDYAIIAKRYGSLTFDDYHFIFNRDKAVADFSEEDKTQIQEKEKILKGVFCGRKGDAYLFMDEDSHVCTYPSLTSSEKTRLDAIYILLNDIYGTRVLPPRFPVEYTTLKIQDRDFPIAFILGYRYGITELLKIINIKHKFIPLSEKKSLKPSVSDIVIEFADGYLVFNRYPLRKSYILAGLIKYVNLAKYTFHSLDTKDAYFLLLNDLKLSINYLKGIDSFFDLFVDPGTRKVLLQMGEPTTVTGLLLRGTEMITTIDALSPTCIVNHRFRSYEKFSDILYNELSRSFASYSAQKSAKKSFSINPEAVFMRIIQDPTCQLADDINPVHDIKQKVSYTFAGTGGRTAQSFVIEDRRFPPDGVGVISEATVDSGKVGMNAYMTANPRIKNILGMYDVAKDIEELDAAEFLSPTSMLIPCVVDDDGKRIGFTSVQLSHHVPCEDSEVCRVRTGYEMVIPHYTNENFACVAKRDGVVEFVDNDLKLIKIRYDIKPPKPDGTIKINVSKSDLQSQVLEKTSLYIVRSSKELKNYALNKIFKVNDEFYFKVIEVIPFNSITKVPGYTKLSREEKVELAKNQTILYIRLDPINLQDSYEDSDIFKFHHRYTAISGSQLKQNLVLTVEEGDRVKRGDVIAYNSGFFEKDPDSRQVMWKLGVMAYIALQDVNSTVEDSSLVSETLSQKLKMSPGHLRTITLTKDTAIKNPVKIGDHVETTDYLCTIEEGSLDALFGDDDPTTLDFLNSLNKKTPKAKYHGVIADIDIMMSCPFSQLSPSLREFAKPILNRKLKTAKLSENTLKKRVNVEPKRVPPGTKYNGIEFKDDTVVISFTITEDIDCSAGDKIVIMSANKTVIGGVYPDGDIITESGTHIDLLFSASSKQNRIVNSPDKVSIACLNLVALEDRVIEKFLADL